MSEVIEAANKHLEKVIEGLEHIDPELLKPVTARLNLDSGALLANQEFTVQTLLPTTVKALQAALPDEDYEPVISLLQAVLSKQSFHDILNYVPIEIFLEGLNSSGLPSLQRVCIEQIRRSDPADLVASTPLVDALLKLALSSNGNDSSEISYEALNALTDLGKPGPLVRRRLLSGESLRLLQTVRHGSDAKFQSRMCDLVQGIYPFDDDRMIPGEFLAYEPERIENYDDLLFALQLVGFYKHLYKHKHHSSLLEITDQQVRAIIGLYNQRDTNDDIRSFFLNHILEFLGVLSDTETDYFRQLDEQYNITQTYSQHSYLHEDFPIIFMALLNSQYLVEKQPESIRNLPYKARSVRALRNILRNRDAYFISAPTSDKLLTLPYLELMVILGAITSTPWGTADLLENWPSVMDNLISNHEVRDKDVISYRREVFERLLDNNSPEALGVWYDGLKQGYKEMVFGTSDYDPGTIIADESGDV